MKRVLPSSEFAIVCGPYLFTITNAPHAPTIKAVQNIKDSPDNIDFCIHFYPTLSQEEALLTHVSIQRAGGILIFAQPLLPTNVVPQEVILRAGELEYEIFPTHQLSVTFSNGHVDCMYVRIEAATHTPYVSEQTDMQVRTGGRCVFLEWFPPNIDPGLFKLEIDPRRIPQRTPLWFKLRALVSGSKSYQLLGFFVPKPPVVWSFHNQPPFSAFQKEIMRLGSASENRIVVAYLRHYVHRIFYETGCCPYPGHPTWNASPDGKIYDSENDTYGVLEMKTSRKKGSMEDYYLPQLYMEMAVLGVEWADLCRYHVNEERLYVYRVNRDPKLEEEMVRLLCMAEKRLDTLQHLVHTNDDFIKMRQKLSLIANEMTPVDVIDMRE